MESKELYKESEEESKELTLCEYCKGYPSYKGVYKLLETGENPSQEDEKFHKPLFYVLKNIHLDTNEKNEIIQLLLEYGANCKIDGKFHFSPIGDTFDISMDTAKIIRKTTSFRKGLFVELNKPWEFKEKVILDKNKKTIWSGEFILEKNDEKKAFSGEGKIEIETSKFILVYEGKLLEGNFEGKGILRKYKKNLNFENKLQYIEEKLNVHYFPKRKRSFGISVVGGKEYFVSFDKENEKKRERTFEGVRLMIVGTQNVGKTTFKTRLIGSINEGANEKAFESIRKRRNEEQMTHGVEIERLYDNKRNTLFSIWDFAGHEEYHVVHSFFFSHKSVYLLLFDCSVELNEIESKNKLLYWFHFLQSQVSKDVHVILVATKYDLLKKRNSFGFNDGTDGAWAQLLKINDEIKKLKESNNITLKFRKFKINNQDLSFFPFINCLEKDISKYGIQNFYNILCSNYDNIEYTIPTTLQHRDVYTTIKKISEIIREEDIVTSFGQSKTNYPTSPSEDCYDIRVHSTPIKAFLTVKELKDELKKSFENYEMMSDTLENILVDLHNLGVIIYINHDVLKDVIICSPNWFNKLSKEILNFGKKKIQMIISDIYFKLLELEQKRKITFKQKKHSSLQKCKNVFIRLMGKVPQTKETIKHIWKNKSAEYKSLSDKKSIVSLLRYLRKIEYKLKEEGNSVKLIQELLPESKKFFSDFSQSIYQIDQIELHSITNQILGENKGDPLKTNYLVDFLINFDFLIPRGTQSFNNEGKKIEKKLSYLVPFLFPLSKPQDIFLFENQIKRDKIERKYEWEIVFKLPFKPTSIWKMLFIRTRNSCIGRKEGYLFKMVDEFYWMDGFLFNFQSISGESSNKCSNSINILQVKSNNKFDSVPSKLFQPSSTIVELNITPNKEVEKKRLSEQLLTIKISANENPHDIFKNIKESIYHFLIDWMKGCNPKNIKLRFTLKEDEKKKVSEDNFKTKFKAEKKDGCAFCGKIISMNDELVMCKKCAKKSEHNLRAMCFTCGHAIVIHTIIPFTKECEKCTNDFLIEKKYAVLKVVQQGGQGRIYQAKLFSTEKLTFAIKERLKDDEQNLKMWEHEIEMLKKIEKLENFTSCRIVDVLDDTERKIAKKYIVMEWIDGKMLDYLQDGIFEKATFNSEIDFMRMMLILLHELNILHHSGIIHRDIKPENIMWLEKEGKLYYYFIDFGGSIEIKSKKEIPFPNSNQYTCPHQKKGVIDFKCDVYSLGKTFKKVLIRNKNIKLSKEIEDILSRMTEEDINCRISTKDCFKRVLICYEERIFSIFSEFVSLSENSFESFSQPPLNSDFKNIKTKIINFNYPKSKNLRISEINKKEKIVKMDEKGKEELSDESNEEELEIGNDPKESKLNSFGNFTEKKQKKELIEQQTKTTNETTENEQINKSEEINNNEEIKEDKEINKSEEIKEDKEINENENVKENEQIKEKKEILNPKNETENSVENKEKEKEHKKCFEETEKKTFSKKALEIKKEKIFEIERDENNFIKSGNNFIENENNFIENENNFIESENNFIESENNFLEDSERAFKIKLPFENTGKKTGKNKKLEESSNDRKQLFEYIFSKKLQQQKENYELQLKLQKQEIKKLEENCKKKEALLKKLLENDDSVLVNKQLLLDQIENK